MLRLNVIFCSLSLLVLLSAAVVSMVFAEELGTCYQGDEQTALSKVDYGWTGELIGRQAEDLKNPLADGNVKTGKFSEVEKKHRPASLANVSVAENNTLNAVSPVYYYLFSIIVAGLVGFLLLLMAMLQWLRHRGIKQSPLFPTAEISRQPFPAVSSFDEPQDDENQSAAPTDEQMQNYPRKHAA